MRRGWLGIGAQNISLNRRLARFHDLENSGAVLIISVEKLSPAATAGLSEGDAIIAIDGIPVNNVDDLQKLLAYWPEDKTAQVTFIRHAEKLNVLSKPEIR